MKKIFLSLCLSATIIQLNAQIEWRNDRTGIYNETGLLKSWDPEGPQMLWYYDGLGEGHSSVAVSNDILYTTGMIEGKGYLYSFDTNGKVLNKLRYGDEWTENYEGTRGTPVINDGKIYIYSGMGDLICLNEKSLEVIWKRNVIVDFDSKNITWGVTESPLIFGDKLIITPGGKEHNVVALDKNTGKVIWSSPALGELSAYCSPLYIGDQEVPLVVTITAHHIVGLEAATGKMLWSFASKTRNQIQSNTPIYSNNMLLCVSVDKGCTMLRLTNGGRKADIVWEIPELDNMMGGMVKIGDYLYGSDAGYKNRSWYCVNWNTGEIMWRQQGIAVGVTIYADGMLYCYSERGEMALVKPQPDKFNIISQFMVTKGTNQHWAHPVIYKGTLYVRHGDSLIAYKIK